VDMNIQITLKTNDIWDITSRVNEIAEIREYICELVEWDDTLFDIRYHSSGRKMIVWFEQDEHALLFKLRWGDAS
jgi:hypothetical protein